METFKVGERTWTLRKELPTCDHWIADYSCSDGDGISLYVDKDSFGKLKSSFELSCFSGIQASTIHIDEVDFEAVWDKAGYKVPIGSFAFAEKCIMLADYFCRLFCEWK